MTIFGRLFGRRSGAGATTTGRSVHLFVDPGGWQARVVRKGGADPVEIREGKPAAKPQNAGALEKALAGAANALEKKWKSVDSVRLVVNDPSTRIEDRAGARRSGESSDSVHDYGKLLLDAENVLISQAAVTAAGSGSAPDGAGKGVDVVAFQDADTLNRQLSHLDAYALKLSGVTPFADLLRVKLSELSRGAPIGGLHLSGHHAQIILMDPVGGGFTARTIGIGLMTIAEAYAADRGITSNEALEDFRKRDLMADVEAVSAEAVIDPKTRPAVDRAIGDQVRTVADEVRRTLEFFSDHRGLRQPEILYLLTDKAPEKGAAATEPMMGLGAFLSRRTGLPTETAFVDPLGDASDTATAERLDFMSDDRFELTLKATTYRVFKKRLVREADIELSALTPELASSGRPARPGGDAPARGRRRGAKARATPRVLRDMPELDRIVGLCSILVLLLGLYGADILRRSSDTDWRTDVMAFDKVVSTGARLKKATTAEVTQVVQSGTVDKVLWTEKFLAIAAAMDKRMWFTDVFLEVGTRVDGGEEIEDKKLVIQGAVLPSTDGHIGEIGKFIRRLKEDGTFMADFREITFEGAFLDRAELDPIIRFTVAALYQEGRRIALRELEAAEQSEEGVLDSLRRSTEEYNERLDDFSRIRRN